MAAAVGMWHEKRSNRSMRLSKVFRVKPTLLEKMADDRQFGSNHSIALSSREPPSNEEHHAITLASQIAVESYPTGWKLGVILLALFLGTLLVAIDNTIIGVIIPKITTVFAHLEDVGWYGSAYLLTVTAFQPIMGNFYKLFQVKVVYLGSVTIFEGVCRNHRDAV
ncbi:MAG: hypothetical protein Q9201_002274 [Fulgogasparrea decipioides]